MNKMRRIRVIRRIMGKMGLKKSDIERRKNKMERRKNIIEQRMVKMGRGKSDS